VLDDTLHSWLPHVR